MSDFPKFSFQASRQLRCLVWLLIAWQLVCVVPGAFLPAMASRLLDGEADAPIEAPAEESESESESLKPAELFVAKKCGARPRVGSELVRSLAISKQFSYCYSISPIHSLIRNGFRACSLC